LEHFGPPLRQKKYFFVWVRPFGFFSKDRQPGGTTTRKKKQARLVPPGKAHKVYKLMLFCNPETEGIYLCQYLTAAAGRTEVERDRGRFTEEGLKIGA
jgi:hypothetical protein